MEKKSQESSLYKRPPIVTLIYVLALVDQKKIITTRPKENYNTNMTSDPSVPGESRAGFPRISRAVELLRPSYDVVVIGSGYGGGVAASRMARGRQSVCVLERGKEKWPGEYPTKLDDAMKEIHVSGKFAPGETTGKWVEEGNPTGLYHLVVGEGQNAFVGCGLGGTSLLNANVFLESDSQVLNMGIWPVELRGEHNWNRCRFSSSLNSCSVPK